MQTIFTHIQSLFGIQNELLPSIKGHDLKKVEHIDQAWLLIEDDRIVDFVVFGYHFETFHRFFCHDVRLARK